MLIATGNESPGHWNRPGLAQSAIFRSLDGGQTWQQVGDGLPESMEKMVWTLASPPANSAQVYAGYGKVIKDRPKREKCLPVMGKYGSLRTRGIAGGKSSLDNSTGSGTGDFVLLVTARPPVRVRQISGFAACSMARPIVDSADPLFVQWTVYVWSA